MFEVHLLASQRAEWRRQQVDPETCKHGDWLSTDGDTIRCCRCASQLVMLPHGSDEFRLEWLTPAELTFLRSRCAA